MPKLDPFIDVLFEKGAKSLVLESGSVALLSRPGQVPLPITRRTLTSAHIYSALAELMPASRAATLASTDDEMVSYDAPAGRVFVRFTTNGQGVRVELEPVARAERVLPHPPAFPPPDDQSPAAVALPSPQPNPNWRPAIILPPPAAPPPDQHSRPAILVPPPPPSDGSSRRTVVVPPAPSDPAKAMQELLELCNEQNASDLHLTSSFVPMLRVDGEVVSIEGWGEPSPGRLEQILWTVTPVTNREQWLATKDSDFVYDTAHARFRVNLFRERSGIGAVLRRIPSRIPSAGELGIPRHVLDLCLLPKGLVLVTGPSGSGKSTTLAALIDYMNHNRDGHIITIEDPIEYVHLHKRCVVQQREIGAHTGSFTMALRAVLREDPDVVLIGEMRDLETISLALEIAETGHLVLGTLPTNTAASSVDRIIDQFPAGRQAQVRTMLSESLKGVLAQTLCKKVGGARVLAMEILLGNGAVSSLIREGKTFQLPSALQAGRSQGMQMLNDALLELVRKKMVLPEEALAKAVAKGELRKALDAIGMTAAAAEA